MKHSTIATCCLKADSLALADPAVWREQEIEQALREEEEIEERQKAIEEQEKEEGIMRMPPMPGSEPLEKDKRNPGSTWFRKQQQELRDLRQRERVRPVVSFCAQLEYLIVAALLECSRE